ncbi:glycoside hydrolase family 36 N-terminal domain-containing protein [Streptomyces sp. NPDC002928]|uniref:glycoside hydrolase family 36 N-terminal domain-containing protein n=1 Tax=Streptomyces sp. NPDC002928 TaxID=3154440 RepID=UPI0033A30850
MAHLGYRISEPAPGTTELALEFRDRRYPLAVTLHYGVHDDKEVIERWTVLRDTDTAADRPAPRGLDRLDAAAARRLPISHVTGRRSAEGLLHREWVLHGATVLTSRRGITSHHANPWLMLDAGEATEDRSEVWRAALEWSGSRHVIAQRTPGQFRAVLPYRDAATGTVRHAAVLTGYGIAGAASR